MNQRDRREESRSFLDGGCSTTICGPRSDDTCAVFARMAALKTRLSDRIRQLSLSPGSITEAYWNVSRFSYFVIGLCKESFRTKTNLDVYDASSSIF